MLCRECPPTYTRLSEMFGTRRSGHGSLRRCSRRLLAVSVRSVGSPGCLLVVCPLAILRGSRWSSEPLLRSKHLLSTRILADRLPTTSPCCLPWTEGPVNSGRFCPVSPSSRRRMARTLRAAPLQHGRPGFSRWHVNPFLCLNLSVTSWLLSFFSGLLELPFAAVFGWKFDEVVQELDHSGFQVQEVSSPTLQLRANL